ncbi:MAG: sugar phosphate isomerase/epimerase family protein [Alphaproteobacteria bacterium]|nr:sugar phosphate isomerase/epimerase family protein [Alphaproteobacteria bacterium]MDP6815459.1 sugar phosphate isomerase/epimerase family protein [Alphaproteobacteria bacterium]
MINVEGFAVNTYAYTFSHSASDCIETFSGSGATGLEVMMYPGHAWPDDLDAGARRALKQKSRDAGLPLITLNMPNIDINIAAAAPGMRSYSIETLCRIIALAGDLEVPGVVVGPGKHNPLMPAPIEVLLGHFHRAMETLVPAAQAAGTRLLVENMPFAFLPGAKELMASLEPYAIEDAGVVYDIANAHFVGEDLGEGFRGVAPRLSLVHVSDTPREVYLHAPVGQGSVPFADGAAASRAVGYDGPVMLEIICDNPDREIPASAAALREMGWA